MNSHDLSYIIIFILIAVMQELHDYVNPKNKLHCPMISKVTNDIIQSNADVSMTC